MVKLVNIAALSFVCAWSLSACSKGSVEQKSVEQKSVEQKPAPQAESKQDGQKPEANAEAAKTPLGAPTHYAVGAHARCPVTGEDFVVSASTVQVEREGKHYAFCCPDCESPFTKNPDKYLKKN